MTEVTVMNKMHRPAVRPMAFMAALILAPVAVALPGGLGIWAFSTAGIEAAGFLIVLAIPVAAVIFGGIPYALFGGPAFVMALRNGGSPSGYGFLANVIATPFVCAYFAATQGGQEILGIAAFFLFFGSIFAVIWGAVFGWLYVKFAGGQGNV